ncbi:hypothetical protein BATDEDRAFT_89890 [Batrachochytrium dendrobatidis JAM81]|uniref:Uncharacterized protein n=2 Tax=Batrachochytrium dendrobatidis TaxID=109871 RepID=F4P5N6_BATDJ|nr:uncharacterized protein BATDEDRAFT_89890 [Batrachochytrium dendrobatidis JAM81]EGF79217.1 hypothetical protein BATDEDRAFT_89890 [Batrachochytrium dendrobatidis JAM81]OAJ42873.1 hypothetical protein BDEG_26273 [Batrachochytrium dendrobatidis JEL423]|eukprot:XP_006680059.1 hypothetical protein BATDEDRAFT_89890 [Batrachochytrium dendrobatidis JAM81]
MSEDNCWKWNEFVEIGNTIHRMRRQVRILQAKYALGIANQLIDNGFIIDLPIKDQQLYETLLLKIAEYLDGNAEAGLDEDLFDITFSPKKSGIQTGFTCDVNNGTQSVCYYIKTHQYGSTEDNIKSIKPPDTKELFVYKILHHIGIGPQAHFIIPSRGTKKTIYIATKDCHLVLLSSLIKNTANNNALLQLDLISRILCLRDCADNTSNCGQVGETPMIVDFRIEKQSQGYAKLDILDKFYEGNSEFHYSGLMEIAIKTTNTVKMDIMNKSLQEWKLLENIERAESEINGLVKRYDGKMKFENDLQRYVQDLKTTVAVLIKS